MLVGLAAIIRDECDRQQDSRRAAQPWDELDSVAIARALVKALREPTDTMVTAAGDAYQKTFDNFGHAEAWRAMVDAILAEHPE